ncbi:MAG: choice-of-anchor D domain-containing protein, partial [Calditrichota bacterium]
TTVNLFGVGTERGFREIAFQPEAIDFGEVNAGRSETFTVTIQNTGNEPLSITGITEQGDLPPTVFTTNLDDLGDPLVLDPGAETPLQVTFNPPAGDYYAATLAIASNAPGSPHIIDVTGQGVYGGYFQYMESQLTHDLVVSGTDLDGDPFPVNTEVGVFTPGGVCAGATLITELGEQFALSAFGDPNGETGFRNGEEISYRIVTPGHYNQALTVWNGNGLLSYRAGDVNNVFLRGSYNPQPVIDPDSNNVHFVPVYLGRTGERSLGITNLGTAVLRITGAEIPENQPFAVTFPQPVELKPFTHTEIPLTFTPEAAQEYSTILQVFSNDPDSNAIHVILFGVGLAPLPPEISVEPASLNFGEVLVGESKDLDLTISNRGMQDLIISNVRFTGRSYTSNFGNNPLTLAGGCSTVVSVTFTPPEADNWPGYFIITSNSGGNEGTETTVNLFGVGTERGFREIAFQPEAIDFGEVELFSSVQRTLEIHNNGNLPLNVLDYTINGAGFSVDWPGAQEVAPGNFLTLTLTFAPEGLGQAEGNLNISSNDENNQQVDIPLTGLGIPEGPHFEFIATESYHALIFTEILVNGEQLQSEDEVGVFTPDRVCAGSGIIEGAFPEEGLPLFAYGDDIQTGEVVEGFRTGEAFSYRVWDKSIRQEINMLPVYFEGPHIWEADGITSLRLNNVPTPEIQIADADRSHGYGDVLINTSQDWTFSISNPGNTTLIIENISSSNQAFTVDPAGESSLEPDQTLGVTVTFTPAMVSDYNAVISVHSNDDDEGQVDIAVSGRGVESMHFDFHRTGTTHSLVIEDARLDNNPLSLFDEIGVFPPDRSCAGAGAVTNGNEPFPVSLAAYGDDPNTQEVDGFNADEAFSFRIWDHAINTEFTTFITYLEGPQVWTEGATTSLTLEAFSEPVPDIYISDDDRTHNFGETALGETGEWLLTIYNHGAADLSINYIESNNDVFTVNLNLVGLAPAENGDNPVLVIPPRQSHQVTVFFAPIEETDYQGTLTVNSDDEDEPNIQITMTGTGLFEPHYIPFTSNANHSLIISHARLDGELLAPRDEVGVFNPGGVCAGSEVVYEGYEDEGNFGVAAWRDDGSGNGFVRDEPIAWRIWDFSTHYELTAYAEYLEGPNLFAAGEITRLNLYASYSPEPDIDAAGVDLGTVILGETGAGSLVVYNRGTADLIIDGLTLEDTDHFTVAFGDAVTLPPQESAAFALTFTPADAIEYQTTLTIHSNDPDEANFQVVLTGLGRTPPPPLISVNPQSIDFGDVVANSSAEEIIHLSNIGYRPLTLSDITVDGLGYSSNYEGGQIVIQRGETNDLTITFTPDGAGVYNGSVTIISDNDDEQNHVTSVDLTGTGVVIGAPEIAVSPLNIAFGEVGQYSSRVQAVVVRNIGNLPLEVQNAVISGSGFSVNWNQAVTLNPQQTLNLEVTFRPLERRDYA